MSKSSNIKLDIKSKCISKRGIEIQVTPISFTGGGLADLYSVAAANGYSEAVAFRNNAAKELSPAVLSDAQTLAGQYFEKYQPKQ